MPCRSRRQSAASWPPTVCGIGPVYLHQIALAAARRSGDRPGQATALGELGVLAWLAGNYPAAAARLADAAALYADIGDLPDQAYALPRICWTMIGWPATARPPLPTTSKH